jgi:hypothetical protein
MRVAARVARLAVVALIAACGSIGAEERPALIATPTEQSRAELLGVVTSAFNGRSVTLADDALTRDSVLIVERREPRDAQGRPVYSWTITPERRFVGPRGSLGFNSAKLDVPSNVKVLELTFAGESGK